MILQMVQELRDANCRLLPDPFGRNGKTRFQAAYDAAGDLAKNYGNNSGSIFWPEHEPIWPTQTFGGDITKPDEYLKAEILNHLIPRDWIEQHGAAVSKSSQTLLDQALLVVHAW